MGAEFTTMRATTGFAMFLLLISLCFCMLYVQYVKCYPSSESIDQYCVTADDVRNMQLGDIATSWIYSNDKALVVIEAVAALPVIFLIIYVGLQILYARNLEYEWYGCPLYFVVPMMGLILQYGAIALIGGDRVYLGLTPMICSLVSVMVPNTISQAIDNAIYNMKYSTKRSIIEFSSAILVAVVPIIGLTVYTIHLGYMSTDVVLITSGITSVISMVVQYKQIKGKILEYRDRRLYKKKHEQYTIADYDVGVDYRLVNELTIQNKRVHVYCKYVLKGNKNLYCIKSLELEVKNRHLRVFDGESGECVQDTDISEYLADDGSLKNMGDTNTLIQLIKDRLHWYKIRGDIRWFTVRPV